jgi:hypothetical protein
MQLSQRCRMVGGSIEESGRDLWIAEHGQPLAESEVGGHNDQGALDPPGLVFKAKTGTGFQDDDNSGNAVERAQDRG